MGYTLKIGEHKSVTTDEYEEPYTYDEVDLVRLNYAPAFGNPTDNENQLWPSYSAWHDSMEYVGLHEFMYNNENGLLREHPGCVKITEEHKLIIDKAHENYLKKYPNAEPNYGNDPINSSLVRLVWLKFWVDWSLKNCQNPVFLNS